LIATAEKLQWEFGFLSSYAEWIDGTPCKMNVQKDTIFHKIHRKQHGLSKVIMASFVSLFISSNVVREFGLPIKDFFAWADDWEFTRRISMKLPSYVVWDSVVCHKMLKNTAGDITKETGERVQRYRYLYRNEVFLYKREGSAGFIFEVLRIGLHVFRILCSTSINKCRLLSIVICSTVNGFSFKPSIEMVSHESCLHKYR
jgi:GT2 family glycosyltransferase